MIGRARLRLEGNRPEEGCLLIMETLRSITYLPSKLKTEYDEVSTSLDCERFSKPVLDANVAVEKE